jgi:hypothetical protein
MRQTAFRFDAARFVLGLSFRSLSSNCDGTAGTKAHAMNSYRKVLVLYLERPDTRQCAGACSHGGALLIQRLEVGFWQGFPEVSALFRADDRQLGSNVSHITLGKYRRQLGSCADLELRGREEAIRFRTASVKLKLSSGSALALRSQWPKPQRVLSLYPKYCAVLKPEDPAKHRTSHNSASVARDHHRSRSHNGRPHLIAVIDNHNLQSESRTTR